MQDGFEIESMGGAKYHDVDLADKEWTDYDEKAGTSVGVFDLQWKFEALRR